MVICAAAPVTSNITRRYVPQFQLGIKRHAFKMRTQIGVDRSTGKIVGFAADHALDGAVMVWMVP
jgi:hypothetical protein